MAIPVSNQCPTCKQRVEVPTAYDLMQTIIMALKQDTNLLENGDYKFNVYDNPAVSISFTYRGQKYMIITKRD